MTRLWALLRCALLGHRYRFVRISLEGNRVFRCARCGKHWETVGRC